MSFKIQSNDPGHELQTNGQDSPREQDSQYLSLAYFILCHVMQRKFKNSARAEPSFLLLNPFVFGHVLVS